MPFIGPGLQAPKARSATAMPSAVSRSPATTSVVAPSPVAVFVEGADVVSRGRAHRVRIADPGMPVGMPAEDGAGERPVGQAGRLHAHLAQAIEAQPAHALDVFGGQPRPDEQIREQVCRPRDVTRERRHGHDGGIGPDFDVGLGTDARQHIGEAGAVERAGAVVEQVGRERRQPGSIARGRPMTRRARAP